MKRKDGYSVGLYCRLSREDTKNGKHDVSLSIENQQTIIEAYIHKQEGWYVYKVYIDDDFSGTTFNRPGFNDLMRDIERGKIDCVITKDLSRLGRNYIEAGRHREFFAERGVRYIAPGDSHDSANGGRYDLITPMKEVINEMYAADVSYKVRETKKAMSELGYFCNSQAPYGYVKSPTDKHKLVIDPTAALIVQRIYTVFANGSSARDIAVRLTAEEIDSPRYYFYNREGKPNPFHKQKNEWNGETVNRMLHSSVYIGDIVNQRREVKSYKNKERRLTNPSDWVVRHNMHEAIIEDALWATVQAKIKSNYRPRTTKEKTVALFSGILKCADCGSPLALTKVSGGTVAAYRCSNYNNKKQCSTHLIYESELCEYVLNDITLYAKLSKSSCKELADRLIEYMGRSNRAEAKALKAQIDKVEARLHKVSIALKSLYEDKASGEITAEEYAEYKCGYAKEKSELEESLRDLLAELESVNETTGCIDDWLRTISKYSELTAIDRSVVTALILGITVGERKKVAKGRYEQTISINYRFIGNLLNNVEGNA